MRLNSKAFLLAASAAGVCGLQIQAASAQDVVFRRPILMANANDYAWSTSPFVPVDANGNPLSPDTLCGQYAVQREATCVNVAGATVDASYCAGLSKPSTTASQTFSGGCTFAWDTTSWIDPGSSCSPSEVHSRSVTCRSVQTGDVVPDMNCSGTKPASSQTVPDYSACTTSWQAGAWVDPGNSCTASETQSRSVVCQRSDGATVDDANCSGSKPSSTQTAADYSGCTFGWQNASWSDWSSSCSDSATRTRTVSCMRSDGTSVDDANCTETKPEASETSAVFTSCDYRWTTGAWIDPGPSCSDAELQQRTVTCANTTLARAEADSSCTGQKPPVAQAVADYSDCANQTSIQWGAWTSASTCSSNTTRTRTGTCLVNGVASDPKFCTTYGGKALSETESISDLSSCTYSWSTGSWSSWSSTCSSSATRTRTVRCLRSDVTNAADSYCSGTKPATSETASVMTGCVCNSTPTLTLTQPGKISSGTGRSLTTTTSFGSGQDLSGYTCAATAKFIISGTTYNMSVSGSAPLTGSTNMCSASKTITVSGTSYTLNVQVSRSSGFSSQTLYGTATLSGGSDCP